MHMSRLGPIVHPPSARSEAHVTMNFFTAPSDQHHTDTSSRETFEPTASRHVWEKRASPRPSPNPHQIPNPRPVPVSALSENYSTRKGLS